MVHMTRHLADPARIHHEWNLDLEPVLTVESGDTVDFQIKAAGDRQVWLGAKYEETAFDFETIYNLAGPIRVDGAAPGDLLQVDIVELNAGSWGWTAFLPGMGLLADDFDYGYLRTYELAGDVIDFAPNVAVPIRPFLGTMGNHPGEPARSLPFPPHGGGGNMDNRHLTAGTTVYLPVLVDGAYFSCGDSHAAQGDGEVCVSAVECPMDATLRFTLLRGASSTPAFSVPAGAVSSKDSQGYFATMGIDADLMTGARLATRAMITKLQNDHGLSVEDAYVLCSIAADLRILEIVDAGIWNVAMTMPLEVFR